MSSISILFVFIFQAKFEKLTREKEDLTSELKQNRTELAIYQSSMVEVCTSVCIDSYYQCYQ